MSRNGSDKEHRDVERSREKELEAQRPHKAQYHEPDRLSRSEDERRWGKGPGKKGSQDSRAPGGAVERLGRAQRCDDSPAPRKERLTNKDRPALPLYDPGARSRARECGGSGRNCKAEASGTGPEKREEAR
ncbi:regulator of nonsense transcription [Saguinus oedipus]|uniref:Regulator of nonsense transcription n=1 Tax=Saguinus oedipus TaxID=9490 RepID=A0ABQ9VUF4_SAGOE|nr:regulator of nonsense transcription [Saguinus oedipus]